jgi:hypothetical protein
MKKSEKDAAMPIPVAQEGGSRAANASGAANVLRGAERHASPATPRGPSNPPRPGDPDYPFQEVQGPVTGVNPNGHTDQALAHITGGDAGKEV